MRFYEGSVYDVWSAVYPEQRGICYQVLDVCDHKKHKPAYIKLGYDRELKVKDNAKLIWTENKKDKVVSIPFIKEDGRLVFDLPAYLKERKIKFKLYKRLTNCAGDSWDTVSYHTVVSNSGDIVWGRNWCIDRYEYWMAITYQKNFPELDGNKVKQFRFDSVISHHFDDERIISWFKDTIEFSMKITSEEFRKQIERWGFWEESPEIIIFFCDESIITWKDIWGTNQ